ncbi:hypothetical protein [Corynebacterium ulcerans]|uniref:hypothetical protein n=1 Tax=Corynebacterium ulcerans TaxID=65058 RepID=UPI000C77420D|nr:hypothetical protein [Corynebacterium ulcerans]PLW01851.1 hypothetical protein BRL54_09535 [Corynebacterium ulcerans]
MPNTVGSQSIYHQLLEVAVSEARHAAKNLNETDALVYMTKRGGDHTDAIRSITRSLTDQEPRSLVNEEILVDIPDHSFSSVEDGRLFVMTELGTSMFDVALIPVWNVIRSEGLVIQDLRVARDQAGDIQIIRWYGPAS